MTGPKAVVAVGDIGAPQRWQKKACLDIPTDVFFPNPSDAPGLAAARRVCGRCPLLVACADHALEYTDTERHPASMLLTDAVVASVQLPPGGTGFKTKLAAARRELRKVRDAGRLLDETESEQVAVMNQRIRDQRAAAAIAERARELRLARGWTYDQIAAHLGCSPDAVGIAIRGLRDNIKDVA